MCRDATASADRSVNGGVPQSISYSTQPVAYRSDRASPVPPRACSGERYCAEPITVVAVVFAGPSQSCRATPKSITLTVAVLGDHHVRRLDVAVHDAAPVREVQRRTDFGGNLQRLPAAAAAACHLSFS